MAVVGPICVAEPPSQSVDYHAAATQGQTKHE